MITLKTGSAVHASHLQEKWNPHCHWIVQSGEPIEAEFIQRLLDKYGPELKAYAINPCFGGTHCVELQFADSVVGKQCNQEYVRGWRKGGAVATKKKAVNSKARKRLPHSRMYILPDGTEFFYYARWDSHGNLIGKVLTEAGFEPNNDGFTPLENRIVHRSVVEQGSLVPKGEERFWVGERPMPRTTAKQRRAVLEAVCDLRAAYDYPAKIGEGYGIGDCFFGELVEHVYKALPSLSEPTIDSAIMQLSQEKLLKVDEDDSSFVWVENLGWRRWSKWNDDHLPDILFSEAGQDWPEWEDQKYWKDIKPSVWKQLDEQYQREGGEADRSLAKP